jgi:hypothetical protein
MIHFSEKKTNFNDFENKVILIFEITTQRNKTNKKKALEYTTC